MSDTTYDTLIIGAGIAGLLAAGRLAAAGHRAAILEKSRGVGGRMATRRLALPNGGQVVGDHGAQYFTARSRAFRALVDKWLADGLLSAWSTDFATDSTPAIRPGPMRYSGRAGMTTVPKALAAGHEVHLQTAAAVAGWDAGAGLWQLQTKDGRAFSGRSLLLTAPVPQSLALLGDDVQSLPAAVSRSLTAITYDPCFAVLAALDGPSAIPEPGGLWPNEDPDLIWLADNQQKGISDRPAVTVHAGPEFTRRHYETDRDEVARRLLTAARPWLGARVVAYEVQRWRYSIPLITHPEACLFTAAPGPLAFAGDAFNGPRVEGAALSGLAAGERLAAWLADAGGF